MAEEQQLELFVEEKQTPKQLCPICRGTGYDKGTKCVCQE